MSDANLTLAQGLVTPITEQGWFKRPAGREGYEVVVLEKVATGNRYYATLRAGESLRFGEVVFGKFLVYAVDVRFGRSFPVEGQFATQERNCKLSLRANVRYRVTDSRQVAVGAEDPLGEIRDRVIDALNREIPRYPHRSVNESVCADIIRRVGQFPHLGLSVESAEILQFEPEGRLMTYSTEEEDQGHKIQMDARAVRAETEMGETREQSRMKLDQARIEQFDLRDPNVFMHMRPDMVQNVLAMMSEREQANLKARSLGVELIAAALKTYIEQKQAAGEQFISLDEVTQFVRENLLSGIPPQRADIPRIEFGDPASAPGRRIDFDDQGQGQATQPRIQFEDPQK